MSNKKTLKEPSTKNKIVGSVILVKFETGKIHQVAINHNILMGFIAAISTQQGSLNVMEEPVKGISF